MLVSPCDSAFQPMRFHAKSPLVYEQITSSLANESARFMIDKNVVWDSIIYHLKDLQTENSKLETFYGNSHF